MEGNIRVTPIPLFEDNYAYLVQTPNSDYNFLIDPADDEAILSWLNTNYPDIFISHIFLTHKHSDHAGKFLDVVNELHKKYH